MIKTYSLRAHGDQQLSANFRAREFASRCGADRVLIDSNLVTMLQRIRDHFGVPVTINSGFRTAEHNRRVGGSTNSQHLRGTAADITVRGTAPLQVARFAERLGAGGIGLYNGFTHVDTRAGRARWDQRSGRAVAVSGFPGFVPAPDMPPQPEPQPRPENILEGLNMTRQELTDVIRQEIRAAMANVGTTPNELMQNEFEQAVVAGITDGTRPRDAASRLEVALMVHRAMQPGGSDGNGGLGGVGGGGLK